MNQWRRALLTYEPRFALCYPAGRHCDVIVNASLTPALSRGIYLKTALLWSGEAFPMVVKLQVIVIAGNLTVVRYRDPPLRFPSCAAMSIIFTARKYPVPRSQSLS